MILQSSELLQTRNGNILFFNLARTDILLCKKVSYPKGYFVLKHLENDQQVVVQINKTKMG